MAKVKTTSAADKIVQEIDLNIRSRVPVLALITPEEDRTRFFAYIAANGEIDNEPKKTFYVWDEGQGLRRLAPSTFDGGGVGSSVRLSITAAEKKCLEVEEELWPFMLSQTKAIFFLCDFGSVLAPGGRENSVLVRQFRNTVTDACRKNGVTVICCGPTFPELPTMKDFIVRYNVPLPDAEELTAMMKAESRSFGVKYPKAPMPQDERQNNNIVSAMLGLTVEQARGSLRKALAKHGGLPPEAVTTIGAEKRMMIEASEGLEYLEPEDPSNYGGYDQVKEILTEAAAMFTKEAKEDHAEPSKGMAMVGFPGCGKDFAMRVAAGIFERPCVRVNMSALMGAGGGIVGQGEAALLRALSIVEAVGGVIGISEFDKQFQGNDSGFSDGGMSRRMFSTVLNWMQAQDKCYLIFTANDIRKLMDNSPEIFRSGRVEDVVFVDFPDASEREAIFVVHLRKREQDVSRFDMAALVKATDGFSGAEIEGVIRLGLRKAHMDNRRKMTTQDVLERCARINPTSQVSASLVSELRAWAQTTLNVGRKAQGTPATNVSLDDYGTVDLG